MAANSVSEIIRQVKAKKEDTLNLQGKGLSEIPEEVFEMHWLKTLLLGHNKITQISPQISQLKNLVGLNLYRNQITSLPDELKQLEKLEILDLGSNKLKNIPSFLFSIGKINKVYVSKSGWYDGELYLGDNPIDNPPLEVLDQGIKAVKNYFDELQSDQTENLYEAKLIIVGEPGAGKTSLSKKLVNANYNLDKNEKSTEGIDITKLRFDMPNGKTFQINIWDFGGQEIYHSTHQFFLTKRSLYILLEDTRAEDTDFNYWMQIIELLSDYSPVFIVQNEKQERTRDLNELGLRGRFKNLVKVLKTNLKTSRGLDNLTKEIKFEISQLDHIGTELPKAWIDIRNEIEKLSLERNHIDITEYLEICSRKGLDTKDRALFLSEYLHDLGVFLHFSDHPVLKRTIILRPEWGTDAVYKVLDNKKIRSQYGLISPEDLKNIWSEDKYEEMQDELLALMMKFELCYQIENSDSYIAPQLLPASAPSYNWSVDNSFEHLEVRYEYEFMPKGIITRFIVRRHHLIKKQEFAWKEGVVLEKEGAVAEVVETYGKKDIRIRVKGANRSELLTIILDEIDRIHDSYHNLRVSKLIPCKCVQCVNQESPFYFKYELLKKYLSKGKKTITCGESVEEVPIEPLIKEISFESDFVVVPEDSDNKGPKDKIKVFVSYSEKDVELKEELDIHLSPIRNLGIIETWSDQDIEAGGLKQESIEENLKTADVILLLISANYCHSDFSYSFEMKNAIQRHEDGTALVIPVLIKPTALWEELPFGKLKATPGDGKAVDSSHWRNTDEAFNQVVMEIREAIKSRFNI